MGHRLSKIYTRTGDDGTTGLADGSRLSKDSVRFEAIGDIDELNSLIGMVLACEVQDSIRLCLTDIQHNLFNLGGELSLPDHSLVSTNDVDRLEQSLDSFNAHLPPLKEFILPGGGRAAATCFLARAVCRRAERSVLRLGRTESVNKPAQMYLNRLSDLLFVLGRVLAREAGIGEVYWRSLSSTEKG